MLRLSKAFLKADVRKDTSTVLFETVIKSLSNHCDCCGKELNGYNAVKGSGVCKKCKDKEESKHV